MASYFQPRILAFVCNRQRQNGADLKGDSRDSSLFEMRIVRVACSRRIEPEMLLEPLLANFDGVLILECLPGHCLYAAAGDSRMGRFRRITKLLDAAHIAERLYLDKIPAVRGEKMGGRTRKWTEKIRSLGPLRLNKLARERLRIAQNNLEARRIREFIATGLIQANGKKNRNRKTGRYSKTGSHEEYLKNWLSLLIEEGPITLQDISKIMDMEAERISGYLLALEKERGMEIPAELRREMMTLPGR